MMKGNRKTIHTIKAEGNKEKLTKARLKELEDAYVKIGNKKFTPPENVKSDKTALRKWREIMELYATCDHVDIVTSADIGLLERYSLMYADYQLLLEAKADAKQRASGSAFLTAQLCNELKLDQKINATAKLLLQMETELFLTPLSKSRAIPRKKKPEDEKTKLTEKGFKLK